MREPVITVYDKILWFPRKIVHLLIWKTTEYYLISFPKAGRTWLRVFLARYLHELYGVPVNIGFKTLKKIHVDVPRIYFSHSGILGEVWRKQKLGYVFSSESELRQSAQELGKKHVVLLIRDPRDIVVSYFFHMRRDYFGREDVPDTLSSFVHHKVFGIENIISYYNLWYDCRNNFSSFLLMCYEDMQTDTQSTFRELLQQLCIPWDQYAYKRAHMYSSFENMRKMEEEGTFPDYLGQVDKHADLEKRQVRKGVVGGFRSYLTEDDIAYVNKIMGKLHPAFGYGT